MPHNNPINGNKKINTNIIKLLIKDKYTPFTILHS